MDQRSIELVGMDSGHGQGWAQFIVSSNVHFLVNRVTVPFFFIFNQHSMSCQKKLFSFVKSESIELPRKSEIQNQFLVEKCFSLKYSEF